MPRHPLACKACRDSKLKCSREEPSCARCARLGIKCEYPKRRIKGPQNNTHKLFDDASTITGNYSKRTNVDMDIGMADASDRTQEFSDIVDKATHLNPGLNTCPTLSQIVPGIDTPSTYAASNASGTADAQDGCWPAMDATLFPGAATTSGVYEALRTNDHETGQMILDQVTSRAKQLSLYNAIAANDELIFTLLLGHMTTKELSHDRPNIGTFLSWALLAGCSNDMLLRLLDIEEVFFSLYTSNLCLVLLSDLEGSAKIRFLKTWIDKSHPIDQALCQSHGEDIPLIVAYRQQNHEAFRLLCKAGALTQAKIQYGLPPLSKIDEDLIFAIKSHDYDGVKMACEAGANVHTLVMDPCGCPKSRLACTTLQGHDTHREGAFNALHWATVHGDERIALHLLQNNAGPETYYPVNTDASALDILGPTVLHEAARLGKLEIIQEVCSKHIVEVDDIDAEGSTALSIASRHCKIEAMELLIRHDASVDREDDKELTPLERVGEDCKEINSQIIDAAKCLMRAGASWRAGERPEPLLRVICKRPTRHSLGELNDVKLGTFLMRNGDGACQLSFKYALYNRKFLLAEAFVRNGIQVPSMEVFEVVRCIWPDLAASVRASLWNTTASELKMDDADEELLYRYVIATEMEVVAGLDAELSKEMVWDESRASRGSALLFWFVKEFGGTRLNCLLPQILGLRRDINYNQKKFAHMTFSLSGESCKGYDSYHREIPPEGYAVMALQRLLALKRVAFNIRKQYYVEALHYYGVALNQLVKKRDLHSTIICSRLLAAFEAVHGDEKAAQTHLNFGELFNDQRGIEPQFQSFETLDAHPETRNLV